MLHQLLSGRLNARALRDRVRARAGVVTVFVAVAFTAQMSAAQSALFSGSIKRFTNAATATQATAASQVANVTAAAPAAGFTLPAQAFDAGFSFTTTGVPGYAFISGMVEFENGAGGPFAANALTTTVTVLPNETQYPFNTLSPGMGFLRLKPGPNGFGGVAPLHKDDDYYFIFAASTGNYAADAIVDYDYGLGNGVVDNTGVYGGWTAAQHTFLTTGGGQPVEFGRILKNVGALAFTGTATASAPLGVATYRVVTGMDSRNAAGTTGTIQLVTPRLAHNYSVSPLPPPLDGTATVGGLLTDFGLTARIELNFLPEPGRFAAFGAGVLALGLLLRVRRRGN